MVVLTFVACASIGYAMCAIVSSVLDSIVATIFVCFAEVRACLSVCLPACLSIQLVRPAAPSLRARLWRPCSRDSTRARWTSVALSYSHWLAHMRCVYSPAVYCALCGAQDPAALLRAHPEEHGRLVEAWSRLKPELLGPPSRLV